ncbi:MAG: Npt1/Npt2 family nucleotide transporter [Blastocatellia bacterium]
MNTSNHPPGQTISTGQNTRNRLETWLGVQPDEWMVTGAFFLYLLLAIACTMVSKTIRDSLFLARFDARSLPYMYLGIALLVSPIITLYVRQARRTRPHVMITVSLALMGGSLLAIWWCLRYEWAWLYPAFYFWDGLMGAVVPMQVWILANHSFTTRQAKRLFGLIGAGGSLGAIIGGFYSGWMVRLAGTEDLMLSIAVMLAACGTLASAIWYNTNEEARDNSGEDVSGEVPGESDVGVSLRQLLQDRYLVLLAAVIALTEISTTLVDFQFKLVAQNAFRGAEGDALTAFFGNLYGVLGVGAFILQVSLTGRLIGRLGIGLTIMLLPLSLVAGSIGFLAFGTLWAAVFLKGPDQLFRHSITRSSTELLYLPVASEARALIKPFIDTVLLRVAAGLAGLSLLALTAIHWIGPRQVALLNLLVVLGWLYLAWQMRGQYVEALRRAVYRHEIEPENMSMGLQHSAITENLLRPLSQADVVEILYVFSLFESIPDRRPLLPYLDRFLDHPEPDVRVQTIRLLENITEARVRDRIARLVEDPDFRVQVEAIEYMITEGGQPLSELSTRQSQRLDTQTLGVVSCFLVLRRGGKTFYAVSRPVFDALRYSDKADSRREAARALGIIRNQLPLGDTLEDLLRDEAPEVASEALRSAGRMFRRDLLPLIVGRLAKPATREAAREALVAQGDRFLGTLRDYLVDDTTEISVRKSIARVISRIGAQEAVDVLSNALDQPDAGLRYAIIRALNKLRSHPSKFHFQTLRIRKVLYDELAECYQDMSLLHGYQPGFKWSKAPAPGDLLETHLREKLGMTLERISRLLGLIYPQNDLYQSYHAVLSNNPALRSNALELLDNIFNEHDRRAIITLIDEDISWDVKYRVSAEFGVRRYRTVVEAVAAMLRLNDERPPAGAGEPEDLVAIASLDSISRYNLRALLPEVEVAVHHPNPLVSDAARFVRQEMQSGDHRTQYHEYHPEQQEAGESPRDHVRRQAGLREQAARPEGEMERLTILEKIRFLQNLPIFSSCNLHQLINIATVAYEVRVPGGGAAFREGDPGDSLFCIVSGEIELLPEKARVPHGVPVQDGDVIGLLDLFERLPRSMTARALKDTMLLQIRREDFEEILADNNHIVQNILTQMASTIRNRLLTTIVDLQRPSDEG